MRAERVGIRDVIAVQAAVAKGASARVMLMLGSIGGCASGLVLYNGHEVLGASVRNVMSVEYRSVTVVGAGLGISSPSEAVRHGLKACELSVWYSDTLVVSLGPTHLWGNTRRVSMTAGLQGKSQSEVFSVDASEVSSIGRVNVDVSVRLSVTMSGEGFLQCPLLESARVGQTACERSEWMSETAVVCLLSHSGSQTRRVSVTWGLVLGSVTEMVSVDLEIVSKIEIGNLDTLGGEAITIFGFGLGISSFCAAARVGQSATKQSDWISESSMMCRS